MTGFCDTALLALQPHDRDAAARVLDPILLPEERVYLAFSGAHRAVAFTSRRIVTQTGVDAVARGELVSVPYTQVRAFSLVPDAGAGAVVRLACGDLGVTRLELEPGVEVATLLRLLGDHVLRKTA